MKSLVLSIFLILCFCVASGAQETAGGSYAGNGTIIGMTNLSALSDCAAASVTGKIKKIKVGTDLAIIDIDADQFDGA